jgi:hypothetical protein
MPTIKGTGAARATRHLLMSKYPRDMRVPAKEDIREDEYARWQMAVLTHGTVMAVHDSATWAVMYHR